MNTETTSPMFSVQMPSPIEETHNIWDLDNSGSGDINDDQGSNQDSNQDSSQGPRERADVPE